MRSERVRTALTNVPAMNPIATALVYNAARPSLSGNSALRLGTTALAENHNAKARTSAVASSVIAMTLSRRANPNAVMIPL